jgi:hypothetical protein
LRKKLNEIVQYIQCSKKFYWCFILFVIFFKYSYFGLKYFPILDDNNMYGVFSHIPINKFLSEISQSSFYIMRPFASILDLVLWSRFWGNMWFVLIVITTMHFFSCYFITKVFEKNNSYLGNIAIIFYIIMPLQFEATYWICASTRIIQGMFFATLSLYLLMKYIESLKYKKYGKIPLLCCFFIFNIISMGFYEQIAAFSFIFTIYIIFINRKTHSKLPKYFKLLILTLPVVSFSIITLYYKINLKSSGTRGTTFKGDYILHTINVLISAYKQLKYNIILFLKYHIVDGISYLIRDKAILYIIIIMFVSIIFAYLTYKEKYKIGYKANSIRIKIGLFAVFVSLIPFFIINDVYIYNRNLFITLICLGLITESIINSIPKESVSRIIRTIAVFILSVTFLIGSVSEFYNYKLTSEIDSEIINEYISVSNTIKPIKGNKPVIVFNVKGNYTGSRTVLFGNCTSSDWAFLGAIQASSKQVDLYPGLTIMNGSEFTIDKTNLLEQYYLGIDENRIMFELYGTLTNDSSMELRKLDNTLFGTIKYTLKDECKFTLYQNN